jgi:polyhydroxybutyrate depolymerase
MVTVALVGLLGGLMAVGWGQEISTAAAVPANSTAAAIAAPAGKALSLASPGDFPGRLTVAGLERTWTLHIPPGMKPDQPAPLVLALHGAAMNAQSMASFSGLNAMADEAKFLLAYPNGTGLAGTLLVWNSGGLGPAREKPDDVGFIRELLDHLAGKLPVDAGRVYAAGLSNGGMMAYRLAAEMPERIAAIAAVGGTLTLTDPKPKRAVPVIHFHGTKDRIVPYAGPDPKSGGRMKFLSVADTIRIQVKLTGCPAQPVVREVPDQFDDGTTVRLSTYGPGRQGAEVVLVDVIGGGHTWPGEQPGVSFIGRSTREISANQMLWAFFQKHPMPSP